MFWGVQQTLLFPLLLLSGMLLPLDDGPGWLQALSKVNPLTYIVVGVMVGIAVGLFALFRRRDWL